MAKAEVRTELKLDDLASATLDKIKGGFAKVDQGVMGAQGHLLDFAKQTAAMAIGANIGDIFGNAKAALMGSFEAANKAQEQMRELSKTVAGMSTVSGAVEQLTTATRGTSKEVNTLRGASKEATTTFAQGAENVYARLSDIARQAGVARGQLVEAFVETGKNTTKTNDQLVMMIGNVAAAARALPAPVKDIVAGFAEIEKNTISASNPLIEMVKQANLFRGHNEQIALKLQSMGRQGMLNIMNKALKEMQERAKKMPMTLKEMGEQLGDMKEDVMKLVGGPMVAALTPAFRNLQNFIAGNRGQIEAYAKTIGTKVGQWVTEAAKMIEEGFKFIVAHADEIKKAIREGFDHAKAVFQWMLDNKGKLAMAAVATKAVTSGAAGGAVDAAKGAMDFAKALSVANAQGIGPLAAGSAGAAVSLGAFAAAMVGVTAAVLAFQGYLKETGGYLNPAKGEAKKELDAQMATIKEIAGSYETLNATQIKEFDKFKARALASAAAAGENTQMIGFNIEQMWAQHRALEASSRGFTEARDRMKAFEGADPAKMTEEQGYAFAQAQQEAAKAFADSFNAAGKSNNQAAIQAAVQTVVGSKALQAALLESGTTVGLSLEKLAEVIGDKAKEFVDKIGERAAKENKDSSAKPPPSVMQFNGGQTFNIKQDFRDQDPDRVAVVFQQDMRRAAENRLQAHNALPFGG